MKTRSDFTTKQYRSAFDKGVRAWFDDVARTATPYRDASFTRAWRAGWDMAEHRQQEIIALGQKAKPEMQAINDPRCVGM